MNKGNQKKDIYQIVTNQIMKRLENHEAENYQNTWFSAVGEIFATNPTSKVQYNGMNQLFLSSVINDEGYTQNRWITLKQGNKIGSKVKKGEKSSLITFYTAKYIDQNGKDVTKLVELLRKEEEPIPEGLTRIPILKHYNVFNLNQFETIPEEFLFSGEVINYSEPERNELAEEILEKSGVKIKYKRFQDTIESKLTGRTPNYYNSGSDTIHLVERKQFKDSEAFYTDALHELGHWTGHKSRFNRNLGGEEDSKVWALEELTAELFSAFMCAHLGFKSQISNNAAYIKSWLSCLQEDNKFVFKAAAQAEKAVKYVVEIIQNGVVLKPKGAE